MLTYEKLHQKPREFLSATSLYPKEATKLLVEFEKAYEVTYPSTTTKDGKVRQRQAGGGSKGSLPTMEDKLLFILVYDKTYPIQTMQGLHFGLSQGRTNYWIHHLEPVLRQALNQLEMLPERDGSALADSAEIADYQIDGTERRRQRPKDDCVQKEHYSGKKKAHTDTNVVVSATESTRIVYLGATNPGKVHDKKLADQAELLFFSGATLGKDTGFQGYEPEFAITFQPKKKPRNGELDFFDCFFNRIYSTSRIRVEHAIGGVKRCRILKDTLRNTTKGFSDLIIEVACGLHNFRVDCRKSEPDFNILDLCV